MDNLYSSWCAEYYDSSAFFMDGLLFLKDQPGGIFRTDEMASGKSSVEEFPGNLDQNSVDIVF